MHVFAMHCVLAATQDYILSADNEGVSAIHSESLAIRRSEKTLYITRCRM
jgi:hypothetical protein